MKKLLLSLAIVLAMASTAVAWQLQWDASTGAAGYRIEHKPLADSAWTVVDVGNVTTWTIPATFVKGTRYEFRALAYAGTPPSYSGYSDTLRWTYPTDTTVIELPAAPSQLILNFTP